MIFVKDFYDNIMSKTSNIRNSKSVVKIIDTEIFINIEAVNAALIMITATLNVVMIFLNHENLCCDIFDDFIIKSCTSELI